MSYTAEGIGLLQSFLQDKSYVNTTVMKRREADKYGNTHYMILNEYKPATDKTTAEKPGSVEPETDNNDLPF